MHACPHKPSFIKFSYSVWNICKIYFCYSERNVNLQNLAHNNGKQFSHQSLSLWDSWKVCCQASAGRVTISWVSVGYIITGITTTAIYHPSVSPALSTSYLIWLCAEISANYWSCCCVFIIMLQQLGHKYKLGPKLPIKTTKI